MHIKMKSLYFQYELEASQNKSLFSEFLSILAVE